MSRLLITGSNGQLGREFSFFKKNYPEKVFYFLNRKELDISNIKELEMFIKINKIDVIINCAAYTNVEAAENNQKLAFAVNAEYVKGLAEVSKKHKIKLIHISTDYVFDGKSGDAYLESDSVNPLNIYGESKLLGEKYIEDVNPDNCIIIRTSWLFSVFGNNFVKTILRLGEKNDNINVINDQFGCPTFARDLAGAIILAIPKIENRTVEKYHYANVGGTSWFEFAKEILLAGNSNCVVNGVTSNEYRQKANRPKNSVLDVRKFQNEFGIVARDWKSALKECVNELKE